MSMFTLSKIVLVVQAGFFTYMVANNGLICYQYLQTKIDDPVFLHGGVIVFASNMAWYWADVVTEYLYRVDPDMPKTHSEVEEVFN